MSEGTNLGGISLLGKLFYVNLGKDIYSPLEVYKFLNSEVIFQATLLHCNR